MNDTCGLGRSYFIVAQYMQFMAYDLMPPFHFFLGIPGHVISLIAFFKQSHSNNAYGYQIYSTISKIANVFAVNSFIYSFFHWSSQKSGAEWFVTSYSLMWLTCHAVVPLMHSTVTNSLLASLCMSVDRVMAISRPFKYKNFNHKKRLTIAYSTCLVISVGSSLFDVFRLTLKDVGNGRYSVALDVAYTNSDFANASAQLRNAIRAAGVFALVVCNVLMVHYYKQKGQKVQTTQNVQTNAARKAQEKVLLLLTVSQSILTAISVLGEVSLLCLMFSTTWFETCKYSMLVSSTVDLMTQISNVLEFYLVLAISKQFRRLIMGVFPCCKQVEMHSAIAH